MIPPPSPVFHGPPARPGRGTLRRLLWASTPVWSLGFLAWVPSLRIAIARRTAGSWAWFALFVAATVGEIVLLNPTAATDTADSGGDQSSAGVGLYIIALMAAAAVHGFVASRPPGPRVVAYFRGPGRRSGYVYGPGYGNAGYRNGGYGNGAYGSGDGYGYVPGPTEPNSYPLYQQTYPMDQAPVVDAVPPATDADTDAAEVQAGLRELRETLERGEDR